MAGYSGTPLIKKLGIKDDFKIEIINSPEDYDDTLGALPNSVTISNILKEGDFDLIQFFTKSAKQLKSEFSDFKKALKPTGMLWISWPKSSLKITTDLNENIIREIGLKEGMVDVKVCAIDDTWSGLKFVFRLKDR